MKVTQVPTRQIRAGDNDRTVFDAEGLAELAASIGDHGLDQPITLRQVEDEVYEIVAGERRFRAMSDILHRESVPAFIREFDDEDASVAMLAENMGRRDLDPVDECKAYQKRMERFGWTEKELADKVGVSVERVKRRLKLAGVRAEILALVRTGQFPLKHAECIAKLDSNRQLLAARPLIEGKAISFQVFAREVEKLYEQQCTVSLFDLALFSSPLQTAPDSLVAQTVVLPPVPDGLPEFDPRPAGAKHTGALLYSYYEKLRDLNHEEAANVLLVVMHGLMVGYYIRLPNAAT